MNRKQVDLQTKLCKSGRRNRFVVPAAGGQLFMHAICMCRALLIRAHTSEHCIVTGGNELSDDDRV